MARRKLHGSAAEKQRAYRARKRQPEQINRNALHVYSCYDCGRRYIGFDAIPDAGCGCADDPNRVPVFVHSRE